MGFVPTSAGLSNLTEPLPCRAVLAPIEGAGLTGVPSGEQLRVQQRWLVSFGALENEQQTPDQQQQAAATAQISALCGEAQRTRATWMILTAVFGLALAAALRSSGAGRSVEEEGRDA